MKGKTATHHFFEVELNLTGDTSGTLSSTDAEGTVAVATPPEFGGTGKPWTPEHLFLGAISGCFMTTLISFSRKFGFTMSHFACHAIGQIEIIEGRYKFTKVDLYPRITIPDAGLKEKAALAVEKTHKYCLISNSVNAAIYYHTEIIVAATSLEIL